MKIINILLGLVVFCSVVKSDSSDCSSYHSVIEGETCESIVETENITFLELGVANPEIDCDNLQINEKLCIKKFEEDENLDLADIGDDDLYEGGMEDDDEMDEEDDEEDDDEMEEGTLVKRAKKTPRCDSKSQVKISVRYNYKYGYPLFSVQKGSAKNVLNFVNGCSGKRFIALGASLNIIDDRNPSLFMPACNNHDICYGCYPNSKSSCDTRFHNNMVALCKKAYKPNTQSLTKCKEDAKTFYKAVHFFGGGGIKGAKKNAKNYNISQKCGFCHAAGVEKALKGPYYLTRPKNI